MAGIFYLDGERVYEDMSIGCYGIIYCAINLISSKIYIGQTTDPYARLAHHRSMGLTSRGDTYFYKSLRKNGWDAFEFITLDWAYSEDELNTLEILWIKNCKTTDSKIGYNGKSGGSHGKHSQYTKDKISKSKKEGYKKGRVKKREKIVISEEIKDRMMAGIQLYNELYGNPFKGKRHKQATVDKMIEKNRGKRFSVATEFPSVSIQCVETGEIFKSLSAAATALGLKSKPFDKLRKDPNAVINGYHWKRIEPDKKTVPLIKVLCVETDEIFIGLKAAQDKTGVKIDKISLVINGKRRRAGGFRWERVE